MSCRILEKMLKFFGVGPSSTPPASTPIREGELPLGIKKINTSLYQVWPPEIGQSAAVDMIFFHGLHKGDYKDAYWKTWSGDNQNSETMWLRTFLPEKIPGVRVLCVSYDAHAQARVRNIGDCLVKDIIQLPQNIGVGRCPVVLVGHSLGGIVMKQFLMSAQRTRQHLNPEGKEADAKRADEIDAFMKNLSGLFYYATPHGGLPNEILEKSGLGKADSPVLDLLCLLNSQTRELNEKVRQWRSNNKIRASAVLESPPKGGKKAFVPYASGNEDHDECYEDPDSDHFTVCQITDENSSSFQILVRFIFENALTETEMVPQETARTETAEHMMMLTEHL